MDKITSEVIAIIVAILGIFCLGRRSTRKNRVQEENKILKKESEIMKVAIDIATDKTATKDYTNKIKSSDDLDNLMKQMNEMIKNSLGENR